MINLNIQKSLFACAIFSCLLRFYSIDAQAQIQNNTNLQAVEAIQEIKKKTLNNCEYEFSAIGHIESNATSDFSGTYGYYCCDSTVILDIRITNKDQNAAQYPLKQYIKRPSHSFVEVYYNYRNPDLSKTKPNNTTKIPSYVAKYDNLEEKELNSLVMEQIKLECLVGYFAHTDLSLSDISEKSVYHNRKDKDVNIFEGEYINEYGKFITVFESTRNGKLRIISASLIQGPEDRLRRESTIKLSSFTEGAGFPADKGGLTSGFTKIQIEYGDAQIKEEHIKSLSLVESYSNQKGTFTSSTDLKCSKFTRQNNASQLEKYAVIIPNFTEVHGSSAFWPKRFMWENGEIVRHRDDGALAVISKLVSSKKFWFLVSPVLLVIICGIAILLIRRRSKRAKKHENVLVSP